jgi:FkbM family methyltransferase
MTDLEVFIDTGANDGLVTEWALKKGFRKIYSIEPDPRAISTLKNKFINEERVTIIEKAVYKYNQTGVRFDTNNDASTVTSMSLDANKTGFPNDGYFLSETVRFSKLFNDYNIGDISVLKIDIEGAEYSILSDFDDRWKKRIKHFLIELHSVNSERLDEVMKFFSDNFYVQFRNHLNDNEEISIDEASKLEMVTLFATNTDLVPNFSKEKNISVIINHCLSLPESDREVKSINSISQIECDSYTQMVNPPFDGLVPVDTCFRPGDISDTPGGKNLTKGHYGCYKSHVDAIMKCKPASDVAYLFFECDSVLCVSPEYFLDKVRESYRICKKYGYYFFSYGPITNVEKEMPDHVADTVMIEAHAYMIPGEKIAEIQDIIRKSKWDVFDLWVSYVFPPQRIGYFKEHLCLQAKGESLIDLNESLTNHLGISKI